MMKCINSEFKHNELVKVLDNLNNTYSNMLKEDEQIKENRLYIVYDKEFDVDTNEYLYTLRDKETNVIGGVMVSEWQIDSVDSN